MLRILGSAKTLCDRITRRDMLRVGGLGLLPAGLSGLLAPPALARSDDVPERGFGRAKRVIVLYLYGAAAQHEVWDLKPEAPAEIRGIFRPIESAVPGIQVCEHLPRLARVADR